MSSDLVKGAVSNFTDADVLQVSATFYEAGQVGEEELRLVMLRQSAGSMSFQHSMTPKQARDMAALLVQCAEALERTA